MINLHCFCMFLPSSAASLHLCSCKPSCCGADLAKMHQLQQKNNLVSTRERHAHQSAVSSSQKNENSNIETTQQIIIIYIHYIPLLPQLVKPTFQMVKFHDMSRPSAQPAAVPWVRSSLSCCSTFVCNFSDSVDWARQRRNAARKMEGVETTGCLWEFLT